jgi:hypothetical protein
LSVEDLAQVAPRADDYVYVSGYSLLLEGKAQALLDWLLALPRKSPWCSTPARWSRRRTPP